ncbi:hypothetical protein STCU_10874 [Strigomonas culicis]|uniref:Guanine nucleotide-binding protein subunit beta-like protein n=1 Tax=Strigomonas culicis TaxID=28005 RepID=S9UQR2_9TRYP|nr:hypothetical protein STCU_10874 [Strigomonas culicis]|eukprot:EPY16976.1 hypothetical protein STCU_10874 [Strigomonas culicis]
MGDAPAARVVRQMALQVDLQSIACSPVENAVAVGGARGEFLYFANVEDNHYFSDHWHHTPLSGIQFSVDGATVYTGALESILLVWNLTSLTHKKIPIRLGSIRCIVPSVTKGSEVLLACENATLAVVDLLQMRVEKSVDGIEWSCGDNCTGVVVEQFRGQPVVILTGLNSILRVCDPVTQQSIYTLHISSQMETIPTPPRHGIQFAGMLRDGRVIVTYEHFAGTTLPSLLRFWAYDAKMKKHVTSQTIYSPHQSEVVAMQIDKANQRVFTLSGDSLKCWEEAEEDANDALKGRNRTWRNQSTSPTSSSRVSSFTLSADGSLCFVADDVIGVYSIQNCRPGYDLPCVVRLYQNITTEALQDVLLLDSSKVVVARQGQARCTCGTWPAARSSPLSLHTRRS